MTRRDPNSWMCSIHNDRSTSSHPVNVGTGCGSGHDPHPGNEKEALQARLPSPAQTPSAACTFSTCFFFSTSMIWARETAAKKASRP